MPPPPPTSSWYHGDTNVIHIFYNIYLYILKDIKRGSVVTELEDFCICIILKGV